MENEITIYTDESGRVYLYQNEESTLIQHEVEELPLIQEEPLKDGYYIYLDGEFSFGYELNKNKCYGAINDLKVELRKTDYITIKESDGEDVSSYGDWKAEKAVWRDRINEIQQLIDKL